MDAIIIAIMKNATNIILINGEDGEEVYKRRKSCFLL
jgi:hypothetical protein